MSTIYATGSRYLQPVYNFLVSQSYVSRSLVVLAYSFATTYLLPKYADIDDKRQALILSYRNNTQDKTVAPFLQAFSGYLIKRIMVIAALVLAPIPSELPNKIISTLHLERIKRSPFLQAVSLSRLVVLVTAIQIVRHLADIGLHIQDEPYTKASISKGGLERAGQFLPDAAHITLACTAFYDINGWKQFFGASSILIGVLAAGPAFASLVRHIKGEPPIDHQKIKPSTRDSAILGTVPVLTLGIIAFLGKSFPQLSWAPKATANIFTILFSSLNFHSEYKQPPTDKQSP